MKVKEVMTTNAKACTPTDTAAHAASLMWAADCGIIPVVTNGGKVVGVITDRDICMAAMTKERNEANIAVKDVISGNVYACRAENDIHDALKTMREKKVRRLPVVSTEGKLVGMLSMNDVVLKAQEATEKKKAELSFTDVVNTYKAICEHRFPRKKAQTVRA